MKQLYFLIRAIAGVGLLAAVVAVGGGGLLAPAPTAPQQSASNLANLTPPSAPLSVDGEGSGVRSEVGIEIGQLAPDFALTDLKGEALKLSDLRGRHLVLLNFWASACPYCREEMPMLHSRVQPRATDHLEGHSRGGRGGDHAHRAGWQESTFSAERARRSLCRSRKLP
jgi:hypothetical protein